jgi:anti-sigma regulatory factor (Ser/Thr protein kinase)
MHELELILSATPAAVGAAREAVRAWLTARYDQETADTATLLVSELVTNAVVYGTGPSPSLTVDQVGNGVLHVAVRDSSRDVPQRSPDVPDTDRAGGRGLFLIESFATAWGWEPLGSGKRVWFELECASPSGG